MVYDHAVKANGKFYPAGADVPEQNSTVSETEIVEEPEKPKRQRKAAQEKSE